MKSLDSKKQDMITRLERLKENIEVFNSVCDNLGIDNNTSPLKIHFDSVVDDYIRTLDTSDIGWQGMNELYFFIYETNWGTKTPFEYRDCDKWVLVDSIQVFVDYMFKKEFWK